MEGGFGELGCARGAPGGVVGGGDTYVGLTFEGAVEAPLVRMPSLE